MVNIVFGWSRKQITYAGDSGNDFAPLKTNTEHFLSRMQAAQFGTLLQNISRQNIGIGVCAWRSVTQPAVFWKDVIVSD